jgi:mono/diheme cytochrome c family protein
MRYLGFKSLLFISLFSVTLAAGAVEPVSKEEAGKIYKDKCAVCHGDRGDGQTRARFGLNPQPRNFTTPVAAAELSRERMITSVTYGRPGTAMVSWKERLNEAQIEGVVDYIRANFMQEPPTEKELAVEDPHLKLGRRIFEQNCRVCHGDRGNGATWTNSVLSPPPRNFTSPQARRILSRERMLTSVTYGRPGTAMMPFSKRLSKDEITAVVDYIRHTFMKGPVVADAGIGDLSAGGMGGHAAGGGHPHAPSGMGPHGMMPGMGQGQPMVKADMSEPFPGGLKGNYDDGRDIFMRNCSTCHGTRGDGLGPRSSFIQPKPRNFLLPTSRSKYNRPTLFRAIGIGKPGTVMPAWSKVLSNQQIADVAEFVFEDFIQPSPDEVESQADSAGDKKKAP